MFRAVDWARISNKLGLPKGSFFFLLSSLHPCRCLPTPIFKTFEKTSSAYPLTTNLLTLPLPLLLLLPLPHFNKSETLSALSAFRKRAAEARVQNSLYTDAKKEIDFEHYRKILKNKAVVEEGEKLFKGFKEASYDLAGVQKSIAAFEGKAVSWFFSLLRGEGRREWEGTRKKERQLMVWFSMGN